VTNVLDLFRLDGKVAVVTGASGGLGAGCSLALAQVGADVVLAARRTDRMADVASEMTPAPPSPSTAACPVTEQPPDPRTSAPSPSLVHPPSGAHPGPCFSGRVTSPVS
jgi:shikimate 5-dehydrogenase